MGHYGSLWVVPLFNIAGYRTALTQHALSYKKGGLITLRHNELRDITAILLKEICHDVRTELTLVEVNREVFCETIANTRPEARHDISALGFWTPDHRVFFDIRVFNLQA